MVYDAVVTGAGPAGTAAAEAIARGGARVLLLERARMPRYKPCGGGITARARAASAHAASYEPETLAGQVTLTAGDRRVTCALPSSVGMAMRERFDTALAGAAVAAGAELRDGTALSSLVREGGLLRLNAGGDSLLARFVVGADGANGITARLAGFPPPGKPATAIEAEVAAPDATLARYAGAALLDFGAVRGGYAWIFGKADHLSAGVYTTDTRARRDLRPALAAFLAGHPDLRAGRVLLQRGHRVPLAGGRSTRQRPGIVLAGDAAALADPLTGEGISYALASGRRAGAAILAALSGERSALAAYDRYVRHDLCGDLRYARWIAAIAYRYPGFGLRLTAEHAGMGALTAAAISGTEGYRALSWRLLRGIPGLARYVVPAWRNLLA